MAGRGDPLRRGRSGADRAAARDALPRRGDRTRSTTRSRACARAAADGRALSVGLLGNAADVVPELARRGEALRPRHRPDGGARPARPATCRRGSTSRRPRRCARRDPDEYLRRARESIARHVEAMLEYVRAGSYVFDYGNNLRGEAYEAGVDGRLHIPGLRPGLYPAALLPRDRARSAGPRCPATRRTSPRSTTSCGSCSRTTTLLQRWLELAPERVAFQGLPARICWLGYGDRAARRARDQRARRGAAR